MIKYATDMKLQLKIIMFDSNKNKENILFKKEFDELANLNNNINIIYTLTEENSQEQQQQKPQSSTMNLWKWEFGRIDKAMILKYVDNTTIKNSLFYICGPPVMLKSMKSIICEELKIPEDNIKVEEFTGY
jgi:NAD(P)H-flavin reductase